MNRTTGIESFDGQQRTDPLVQRAILDLIADLDVPDMGTDEEAQDALIACGCEVTAPHRCPSAPWARRPALRHRDPQSTSRC